MTVQELAARYGSKIVTRRWLATIVDLIVLFFGDRSDRGRDPS
jgi:hypothetical protein